MSTNRLRLSLFGLMSACCLFFSIDLDVLLSSPVPPIEYLVIGWCAAALSGLCAIGCAVAGIRMGEQ